MRDSNSLSVKRDGASRIRSGLLVEAPARLDVGGGAAGLQICSYRGWLDGGANPRLRLPLSGTRAVRAAILELRPPPILVHGEDLGALKVGDVDQTLS